MENSPPHLPSLPVKRFGHDLPRHAGLRIHQTLRVTPAMAAGVTERLWEVADIVTVLEAWEARRVTEKSN